jgi:hypothetical protein
MWEPQPLTTLRASKACRGENFTFLADGGQGINTKVDLDMPVLSEIEISELNCD